MANNIIVPIPTELKDIKSELIFGLTKRQIIGFGITGAIAVPLFLILKNISLDLAMYSSFFITVPIIFLTIYKTEKLPSEKWLKSILEHKVLFSEKRQFRITEKNLEVAKARGFIKDDEKEKSISTVTTSSSTETT